MIHFIFRMLFIGAFLGVMTLLCLWFFAGVTIHQSFEWLRQKITQTQTTVSDSVYNAGTNVTRQIENVARKLD